MAQAKKTMQGLEQLMFQVDFSTREVHKSIMDGRNLRKAKVAGVTRVEFSNKVSGLMFVYITSKNRHDSDLIATKVEQRLEELHMRTQNPELFEAAEKAIWYDDSVSTTYISLDCENLIQSLVRSEEGDVKFDGVHELFKLINMLDEVDYAGFLEEINADGSQNNRTVAVRYKTKAFGRDTIGSRQLMCLDHLQYCLIRALKDPNRKPYFRDRRWV